MHVIFVLSLKIRWNKRQTIHVFYFSWQYTYLFFSLSFPSRNKDRYYDAHSFWEWNLNTQYICLLLINRGIPAPFLCVIHLLSRKCRGHMAEMYQQSSFFHVCQMRHFSRNWCTRNVIPRDIYQKKGKRKKKFCSIPVILRIPTLSRKLH